MPSAGLDKYFMVVYNIYTMTRAYKMIRLDPEVYNDLELFRNKRETFSDAVFRLLCLHRQMRSLLKDLAGELPEQKYKEDKHE